MKLTLIEGFASPAPDGIHFAPGIHSQKTDATRAHGGKRNIGAYAFTREDALAIANQEALRQRVNVGLAIHLESPAAAHRSN